MAVTLPIQGDVIRTCACVAPYTHVLLDACVMCVLQVLVQRIRVPCKLFSLVLPPVFLSGLPYGSASTKSPPKSRLRDCSALYSVPLEEPTHRSGHSRRGTNRRKRIPLPPARPSIKHISLVLSAVVRCHSFLIAPNRQWPRLRRLSRSNRPLKVRARSQIATYWPASPMLVRNVTIGNP